MCNRTGNDCLPHRQRRGQRPTSDEPSPPPLPPGREGLRLPGSTENLSLAGHPRQRHAVAGRRPLARNCLDHLCHLMRKQKNTNGYVSAFDVSRCKKRVIAAARSPPWQLKRIPTAEQLRRGRRGFSAIRNVSCSFYQQLAPRNLFPVINGCLNTKLRSWIKKRQEWQSQARHRPPATHQDTQPYSRAAQQSTRNSPGIIYRSINCVLFPSLVSLHCVAILTGLDS